MSNVWQTQCQGISTRWLKEAVKARLQDQFVQRTDNLINVNSKCFLYKDIKQDHTFEDYLVNLPRCFYCCVCAPSDDYVIGCLLTRRGSKMLGMHQMVDCVNCMFGYCVLIGCLATEGGRQ